MIRTTLFLVITLSILVAAVASANISLTHNQESALNSVLWIVFGVAMACFIIGEITNNNSQVDKLWSIIPIAYVWHFTFYSDFEPRMVLMSVLVTVWGLRLTYNFSRRGGYSLLPWKGEEDYRWSVLRAKPEFQGKGRWMLFNLFFICLYQNALIFLFTLPILEAWRGNDAPLGWLDYTATALFLGFLTMETIADQQQYNYQTEKYRRKNSGEALGEFYGKGFTHTGLWAKMRHPNYAAEQAIWLSFYLFSVSATGEWLNWSISGAILLLFLFRGSSNFSEDISTSKYPQYTDYKKTTPRFIPWF